MCQLFLTISIKDLCKWKGVEILEGHMMSDHVYLLVSIPPKYSISQMMGYLKGKSAMMIFERHINLEIDTFGLEDTMLVRLV